MPGHTLTRSRCVTVLPCMFTERLRPLTIQKLHTCASRSMSHRTAADRRSAFHSTQSLKFQLKGRILIAVPRAYASALLFVQLRVGFIRRRLGFGALGFAQRSFLVPLSLFLLAASTCRPRSLGSISSVIRLKCHRLLAGITHSALYKHVAIECPLLAQSGRRGPFRQCPL